jgi:hypothetical protein
MWTAVADVVAVAEFVRSRVRPKGTKVIHRYYLIYLQLIRIYEIITHA